MKSWPDNNELVWVEDLLDPVRRAFDLGRPLVEGEYDGYNIGPAELACALNPEQRLGVEGEEGSPSKDRLDRALLVAFQLGIEQGRRLERRGR